MEQKADLRVRLRSTLYDAMISPKSRSVYTELF